MATVMKPRCGAVTRRGGLCQQGVKRPGDLCPAHARRQKRRVENGIAAAAGRHLDRAFAQALERDADPRPNTAPTGDEGEHR
jgi:hypothetical protein